MGQEKQGAKKNRPPVLGSIGKNIYMNAFPNPYAGIIQIRFQGMFSDRYKTDTPSEVILSI